MGGLCKSFSFLVSHFQATIWALNRRIDISSNYKALLCWSSLVLTTDGDQWHDRHMAWEPMTCWLPFVADQRKSAIKYDLMPTNRSEIQCWLVNTSQQYLRILLSCFRKRMSAAGAPTRPRTAASSAASCAQNAASAAAAGRRCPGNLWTTTPVRKDTNKMGKT